MHNTAIDLYNPSTIFIINVYDIGDIRIPVIILIYEFILIVVTQFFFFYRLSLFLCPNLKC